MNDEVASDTSAQPVISFYRVVPTAPAPMRADRSALGIIPTSAFQYCEAITSASAFGYYIFPPMDFHVQFDGTDFIWTSNGGEDWFSMTTEHFPDLPEYFDAAAPEEVRGFAPPFVTRLSAPGILQVWSGFMIRTKAGWSALVRPPANLPRSQAYEPYEGIIETDRWFYPLFINMRITTTHKPISFETTRPLFQVQPLLRSTYAEDALRNSHLVEGLENFTEQDWKDYHATMVTRGMDPMMRPGRYATTVRKRGSRED
jgi:hypothetical protein